jgi:hypothetical protein
MARAWQADCTQGVMQELWNDNLAMVRHEPFQHRFRLVDLFVLLR